MLQWSSHHWRSWRCMRARGGWWVCTVVPFLGERGLSRGVQPPVSMAFLLADAPCLCIPALSRRCRPVHSVPFLVLVSRAWGDCAPTAAGPVLVSPLPLLQFAAGVVIAPIRLFLVAFTLCFGLFVGLTFLAGLPDAALQQRLRPGIRKLIYYLIRIFSRVILFIVGLYKIEEHRLADEAAELADLDGTPFLLVSNHVSFLDITYHFARDAVAFVAKVEVRRLPIIGRIAAIAQCIFTSRAYVPPSLGGSPVEGRPSPREVGRPAAAGTSVAGTPAAEGGAVAGTSGFIAPRGRESSDGDGAHAGGASAKIGSRLQQRGFPTTLLFPEGTTSNNCALLRFRTGAFIHGAPVKPVLLQWYVLALCGLAVGLGPSWWRLGRAAFLPLGEVERGTCCLLDGHVANTSACHRCVAVPIVCACVASLSYLCSPPPSCNVPWRLAGASTMWTPRT